MDDLPHARSPFLKFFNRAIGWIVHPVVWFRGNLQSAHVYHPKRQSGFFNWQICVITQKATNSIGQLWLHSTSYFIM